MLACVGPCTYWPAALWAGDGTDTPVYDPTNGLTSEGILWITDVGQMSE